jgi:transcriptional regulator with XRE-family HTH domain
MKTVNRALIDAWVEKNAPDGVIKLAQKSKVSRHSIAHIRIGKVPRSELIRDALAIAIGVSEVELFPVVGATEEVAS